MTTLHAIHQFHASCTPGDGVTKSLFYIRRLLRALGFESDIFCEHIPAELQNDVRPLGELDCNDAGYLLLHHHSLGYRNAAWLDTLKSPRVLVYHNITPAHLLPPGDLPELSRLGREQLTGWAAHCIGGIGVSDYNSDELRTAGYREVATLPMLVDLDEMRRQPADRNTSEQLRDTLNVLFVGRISENKRQHEIIEVFDEFRHFIRQPARLILAGGVTSGAYLQRLQDDIAHRGIQDQVLLAGKADDDVLQSMYRVANLFVCLSEHEGFCMPAIEAMMHDVPVIARDAGALATTLGEGGILLDANQTNPTEIAAIWHTLIAEPALRRRVIAGQRRNLQRYRPQLLLGQLADYLRGLGFAVPVAQDAMPADVAAYWQVEGPIDSTYSLAIVNREMGMALSLRGHDVGLHRSTEGGGSSEPHWLDRHAPAAAALAANAQARRHAGVMPAVALRFDYPPWVDGMAGMVRGVHSYGWEESHFPGHYVAAFNRGLDLVTTLSTEVAKILRDSGVRIPIAVVGTGVDHILRETPEPMEMPDAAHQASFRFLHVSSCFPRKGIDALIAAYGQAFRKSDDAVLIIKTFPNPHNDVAEQLAAARRADADYPDVVLINRDVSQSQMLWLYRFCHALVAPSRGEGFGMPMAEAMLFELPVIVTAWGGQSDFCTQETAWLCDYDFAFTNSHVGTSHSVWAEPRVDHLAQRMREVFEADAQTLRQRTDAARVLCLREFSWNRVAERTEQALAALDRQPAWRKEPNIGWLTTWNTRCGIATYSQFLSTAFPDDRMTVLATRGKEVIAPDQDYVSRCWDESIDTVDVSDVLAQVRERNVGALVIQYNFGFFSIQALARIIRELHAEGIPTYVFMHATADVDKETWQISLRDIAGDLALAERLVVHGVSDLNRLKSFGLVSNVMLFPHGVLATPEPAALSTADMTPTQRRLHGKRVIATYGFLLPHKGVKQLIRAFARLAENDARLHLLVSTALYPSGVSVQEKRECEALINELGLAESVTMVTDFLPDSESLALMQMAELIVYPYQFTQESASGAVRIGLASGRPVAVTPLGIFDDVADAVHKLPGTDEKALAQGIGELLADPQALETLRERCRQWCEPRQWDKLSVRLLDLIDGVANDFTDLDGIRRSV